MLFSSIGFPNLLQHEEILHHFSAYGEIVDHYFADDNRFAIIQFDNEQSVEQLLSTTVILRGRRLNLKRRILKKRETGKVLFVDFQNAVLFYL